MSPNPDQDMTFQGFLALAQTYGIPAAVIALLGVVWRSSSHVTAYEEKQRQHSEKIAEHQMDIATLKLNDAAMQVSIAALPSRQDLRDMRDETRAHINQLQSHMQSGFENITTMMKKG